MRAPLPARSSFRRLRDWRGFSYAHLLLASTGGDLGGDNGGGGVFGSSAGGAASSIVGSGGVGGTEAGEGTGKECGALLSGGGSAGAGGGDGGGGGDGAGGDAKKVPYKAGFLDDPALKVGRHRHMTRGDQHTGPVVRRLLLLLLFLLLSLSHPPAHPSNPFRTDAD